MMQRRSERADEITENVIVGEANDFTADERQEFMRLVQKGGEVGNVALKRNIDRARRLVFLRVTKTLVGIAALKIPEGGYRERISAQTGVKISESDFPLELGYVFVVNDMRGRGLSHRLVGAALDGDIHQGIYATSRADNISMHRTLERVEFRPIGKPYIGRSGPIQLLVREAR